MLRRWHGGSLLELRDACAGTVLVLLGRAAPYPARAFQHPAPEDRHRALARDHVPALGRDDALDDRTPARSASSPLGRAKAADAISSAACTI